MDPIVILGSDVVSVAPGHETRVPVRIRNRGRRVESYRVEVLGAPAAFAQVLPSPVSVLPGREAEVDVIFRPPGGPSTPAGALAFGVRATSEVDESSSAVTEGRLDVIGVAGMQAWVSETTRTGRWSATFRIDFANLGNAGVRLALSADDPTATTRLKLDPDIVDVTAGAQSSATLHARTTEPFLRGPVADHSLQVTCQSYPFGSERPRPSAVPQSGDANHRSFQLTFRQRPILPKFVIPLVALGLAAALAFAAVTLRRTKGVGLDITSPAPPASFTASTGGVDSIFLSWTPVPNAEGYKVERTKAGASAARGTIVDDLSPAERHYTVQTLQPQTNYCFVMTALGPGDADSHATTEACASTGSPTNLTAPADLRVDPIEADRYQVTWTYDDALAATVVFSIFVDGTANVENALSGSVIEIARKATERPVTVVVRAQRGGETVSSENFVVTVPALPVSTTTSTAPPTTVTTVTPTTVGTGSSGPTTSSPPSTTTPPPTTETETGTTLPIGPARDDLRNVDTTFAAVLGSARSGSGGGVSLDERKSELSAIYQVDVADMDVFTNRDTIVVRQDGRGPGFDVPIPGERFVFVPRSTAEEAATICAKNNQCVVVTLTGAARSSEGTPVLELERLPADVPTAALDAKLEAWRERLAIRAVYAVAGAAYPGLQTNAVLLFVSGLGTAEQIQAFCANNPVPSTCPTQVFPLQR